MLAFESSRKDLAIAEIAEKRGINRSVAWRLLRTLE